MTLLLLCVRRHLLLRLDSGAMLTLAKVIVADLTPATKPSDEVLEYDFACEGCVWSGLLSKSSSIQRWLRGVTEGGGCSRLRRRNVLTHRRKGLGEPFPVGPSFVGESVRSSL